jgi:adenine-specific DNA-methyltransferase
VARTPTQPAEIENYSHGEAKRRNIPTAENQGLVPDEEKAVKTLRYPRNPDLDPQLVWRGKDDENGRDLEVQAPPIYIQEKIHPRVLIEELKRRSARTSEPQIDLFHDFNGLPDAEARTEFYAHEQNWSNRMILGDSLLVMGSLAERERLRGQVQTIYFDPPYGIRFNSNWQPSTKTRDVRDNKLESVSREPEVIRAFRDTWVHKVHSYLSYLRDRLVAARDLLAESGALFVQIGDENLHLVRSLLDEVMGDQNFVSQITVAKTSGATSDYLAGVADYILFYAKSLESLKYRPLTKEKSLDGEGASAYVFSELASGVRGRTNSFSEAELVGSRSYRQSDLRSSRPPGSFPVEINGRKFVPGKGYWKTGEQGFARLIAANRVAIGGNTLNYVRYLDDYTRFALNNIWEDVGSSVGGDKVYVVQTSTKIVERCLLMTTDPGDLVLDPTCGSGTTAFVAEQWGRRWITIDTSRVALALARTRLMTAKYDYYLPRDSAEGAAKESELVGKPLAAPEAGCTPDLRQGFVYERAPRVTLKSIANNAEIDVIWDKWQPTLEPLREKLNAALGTSWQEYDVPRDAEDGWSPAAKEMHAAWWAARRERQKEIDESIARGAEVELLYDRPYKAKNVVRVAGPFTVESLSPHRVLPLAEDPLILGALDENSDAPPLDEAREQTDFAQVVLEQLKAAGVQNTKKGEAIKFEWLKPFPSNKGYVAFEGVYLENGQERRAAVAVGPEYDTVGYDFVRGAAREAATLFDTLIICGFAFSPEVDDTRLSLGNLTVLKARMNQDLRMSDKLKATGAGNLFVVFGEPDIEVQDAGDGKIKVEIKGVDIFDPTTGDVKSSDDPSEDIACWFIDDDYDDESFFVRQAYFLGRDPYDSLRRALKAEIDQAAWTELNSTESRPFTRPQSGKICVKVINHFGDEVQKVFSV